MKMREARYLPRNFVTTCEALQKPRKPRFVRPALPEARQKSKFRLLKTKTRRNIS